MSKRPAIKNLPMLAIAAVAGTLALGAWAANAPADADGGAGRHHRTPAFSVERVAMRNLIVNQLAGRTGRSATEIGELLQSRRPREVAETLGLDEAAMKEIFASSRLTLIDQAVQAQMITAAQGDELKNAPPPGRLGQRRRLGKHDQGPRDPSDAPPLDDDGE